MSKLLYLDNAATTKTAPEVVEAMLPYFTEKFGNPSSVYSFAAANKEVINQQRDAIAEMIGAKSNEIYFTGGGSESDNWALNVQPRLMRTKVTISLQQRSSIMRFFIKQSILKKEDLR